MSTTPGCSWRVAAQQLQPGRLLFQPYCSAWHPCCAAWTTPQTWHCLLQLHGTSLGRPSHMLSPASRLDQVPGGPSVMGGREDSACPAEATRLEPDLPPQYNLGRAQPGNMEEPSRSRPQWHKCSGRYKEPGGAEKTYHGTRSLTAAAGRPHSNHSTSFSPSLPMAAGTGHRWGLQPWFHPQPQLMGARGSCSSAAGPPPSTMPTTPTHGSEPTAWGPQNAGRIVKT